MKTLSRVLLSSLGVVAIMSVSLHASAAPRTQTSQPLRYGATLTGTLTEETPCDYYTFEGTAGDPVTVDMTRTGGNLDGTLALYRGDLPLPGSAPVTENDDRPGGGLDPLIALRLPETGHYTIAACRLQAENMRVTTGTYTLTLSGPDTLGEPTSTPAGALSDSLFGAPGGESAITATPPSASNDESPLLGLLTGDGAPALAGGATVEGVLDADTDAAWFDLPVQAGDVVTLRWVSIGGNLRPRLRITSESGGMIAEAATADPTAELTLTFAAPASETAALAVTRYAEALDGTAGAFTLAVEIQRPAGNDVAPPATGSVPPDAAEASDYLTNACQSGGPALSGPTSADTLTGVYTAAGDSYYVEELTRTTVFAPDDDMNIVFEMQNTGGPATVAGVFCAPDGSVFDAGEGEFEMGGPFLIGLDWEFYNAAWQAGAWYAELYVNGTLALTLAFNVSP